MKFDVIMGRVFLSLLVVLAVLAGVEGLSRWLLPPSRSPVEQNLHLGNLRQPKPYVMFGGTPHGEYQRQGAERLNALGYRGPAPGLPKDAAEFRVVMLGGSTVLFGEPTLAVLLEQALHASGKPHARVFNFGVISSNSGMELARVVFELTDLKPDLVIMYSGGNDLLSHAVHDPRPGYPFNFMAYEHNPLLENDLGSYPATTMFLFGSRFLRHVAPSFFVSRLLPLERLRAESGWGSRAWLEAVAGKYVDNVVKADAVCRGMSAQFLAVFQPLIHFKEPLSDWEQRVAGISSPPFQLMREVVRTKVAALQRATPPLQFSDASDLFDGAQHTVFSDPIHLEQQSYEVVVARLLHDVQQRVR